MASIKMVQTAFLFWVLLLSFIIISIPVSGQNIFDKKRSLIVIDPGHGGKDSGAKGPKGSYEKDICLKLALTIQEIAYEQNTFKVLLTRKSDYSLEPKARISIANQKKADLFLSLHTGASFLHNIKGIYVYTFSSKLTDMVTTDEIINISEGSAPELWKNVQKKHLSESERFSTLILKELISFFPTKNIYRSNAPLSILKGADMPAISVSFGYITHPIEEKFLGNPDNLNQCAEAVIKAIGQFLSKK